MEPLLMLAIKARILAEHKKHANCGVYNPQLEDSDAWAELAARKIVLFLEEQQ